MQFNSHATNQDLVTLSNKLSGQTDVSFPLVEKVLYANMGDREIMSVIHSVYGGWKYDDRNQTDLPEATTQLVTGQDIYTLPTDSSFLDGVYYQDENTSTWHKLRPITKEELYNEQDFYTSNSIPAYYMPIGNTIKIYPPSNFTKDNALKVQYSRNLIGYTTSSTTTIPPYDSQFHEATAVYMAFQKAVASGLMTKKDLGAQWLDKLDKIKKHYHMKYKELFPTRIKASNSINEYI